MGTVAPVVLVYRAIPQQLSGAACKKLEVDNDRIDYSVCKVNEALNLSTEFQFTSLSSIEFLLSTDPC